MVPRRERRRRLRGRCEMEVGGGWGITGVGKRDGGAYMHAWFLLVRKAFFYGMRGGGEECITKQMVRRGRG